MCLRYKQCPREKVGRKWSKKNTRKQILLLKDLHGGDASAWDHHVVQVPDSNQPNKIWSRDVSQSNLTGLRRGQASIVKMLLQREERGNETEISLRERQSQGCGALLQYTVVRWHLFIYYFHFLFLHLYHFIFVSFFISPSDFSLFSIFCWNNKNRLWEKWILLFLYQLLCVIYFLIWYQIHFQNTKI